MLAAVAFGDGDDQLLADVAREVEVDVRDGVELAVEEAAERELGADRVDVREAGQVADERADRRAAPAAGRQRVTRRVAAAHLERAFARELEHVPVQEEEAGEPELVDQLQLLLEPRARLAAELVASRVALLEGAVADVRELDDRRLGAVGEVRVAVAELLGEVEPQPLGELDRARDRGAILRETLAPSRAGESRTLSWLPRRSASQPSSDAAVADGDEDVLEQARAAQMVRVDVARDDRPDAERLGEIAQTCVAARVAALVRTLELDEEPLAAESAGRAARQPFGLRTATPCRAQPERQTSPSFSSSSSVWSSAGSAAGWVSFLPAACVHAPR